MTLRSIVPFLPLWLLGCGPVLVAPDGADADAQPRGLGNWAEEATNGVGTHEADRPGAQFLDADGRVLTGVDPLQQMVLTGAAMERSGETFHQAVLKGGAREGEEVWAGATGLSYTTLVVCGAGPVPVRGLDDLAEVQFEAVPGERLYVTDGTVRNTGQHRYFQGSLRGAEGYVATDGLCALAQPGASGDAGSDAAAVLANHDRGVTTLWDQTFGRQDGASPLDNIEDAAAGRPAKTSCYGGAPCDEVMLAPQLLAAMVALGGERGFSTFVTAIAGASHSAGSYHYEGRAFDIDEIDGQRVQGDSAIARAFMEACWDLGAVEVFGPSNDPVGHFDHIHCAF